MKTKDLKARIHINNIEEFKKLLVKAKRQSEQLEQTITQIETFEFDTDVDFKSES